MYKFDPQAPGVSQTFREIAVSQLEAALNAGAADEPARRTALLEARRRTKKVRGLLKLVRGDFATYQRETMALRDASAALSAVRDREVLKQTVEALNLTQPDPALPRIAARLEGGGSAADADQLLADFRAAISVIRTRAESWALERDRPAVLFDGLRAGYRACRRQMRRAARLPNDERLHEWRKALKAHAFHLALLRRAAPEVIGARHLLVDRLGDMLGLHHDLINLRLAAEADPQRFGEATDIDTMNRIVTGRLAELEAAAFALGRQVLDEKPKAFTRRMASYWQAVKAVTA